MASNRYIDPNLIERTRIESRGQYAEKRGPRLLPLF